LIRQQGYVVELKPNKDQRALLLQSTAVHRKSYNYALAKAKAYRDEHGKYPILKDIQSINKDFTFLKKNDSDYDWFKDVSKCSHQLAIFDLKDAFKRFYSGKSLEPKFKSIFRDKKRFHFDNTGYKVSKHSIKIPKIGYVRFKEAGRLPLKDVKYLNFTVSLKADRWYISACVEFNVDDISVSDLKVIGIDLGIKDLITCSNSKVYNLSNKSKHRIKRRKKIHKRFQRKLSKQVKGSNRRKITRSRMSVNYKKICNIKSDAIHKITSDIAKSYPKVIVTEDLVVINMLKNHKLVNSISDCSWGEILRQLQYKSEFVGGQFYQVDRFFPSSKTCSCCGSVKSDLKLSHRTYICNVCGFKINRDLNAAINIKNCYINGTGSRSESVDLESIKRVEKADVNAFCETRT